MPSSSSINLASKIPLHLNIPENTSSASGPKAEVKGEQNSQCHQNLLLIFQHQVSSFFVHPPSPDSAGYTRREHIHAKRYIS